MYSSQKKGQYFIINTNRRRTMISTIDDFGFYSNLYLKFISIVIYYYIFIVFFSTLRLIFWNITHFITRNSKTPLFLYTPHPLNIQILPIHFYYSFYFPLYSFSPLYSPPTTPLLNIHWKHPNKTVT